jgi:drug/metabolite transporter (DMT)-like permease
VQAIHPGILPVSLVTDPLTLKQHLQLELKSVIVAASWIFTYFALKYLPLSLGSPIRATSPLWTLFGALLILGERPTLLETLGVITTLVSFVGLSFAGRREGVHFHRDKWVGFIIAGTLLGAVSSLYDKYLLGRAHFSVPTVQAWFSVYLLVFFLPLAFGWKRRWWSRNEFHWRWSIPFIAFSLLVADYIYFSALARSHFARLGGDEPASRQHAGGVCGWTTVFRRTKRMAKTSRRDRHSVGHRAHGVRVSGGRTRGRNCQSQ